MIILIFSFIYKPERDFLQIHLLFFKIEFLFDKQFLSVNISIIWWIFRVVLTEKIKLSKFAKKILSTKQM